MNRRIVNCPHCGKIISEEVWKGKCAVISEMISCPYCGSKKLWRDGKRKIPSGETQRYLCRDCGLRFSQC